MSLQPHFDDAHVPGESRRAVRQGLGVALATSAYGVSFGALAVAAGLDIWQTCVMSLVMFTGGSQFAFVGVIAAGGLPAAPAAIASASLLGVRNIAYGMRMSPVIGAGFWRRAAAAQFTIDESTAVSLAQTTRARAHAGLLGHRHRDLRRLEPVDARRRAARRRARRPQDVRTGCRGRGGLPRAAVAAPAAPSADRRGHRRGGRRHDADSEPHARDPRARRGDRGDRRRLVQLAGRGDEPPEEPEDVAERVGLP